MLRLSNLCLSSINILHQLIYPTYINKATHSIRLAYCAYDFQDTLSTYYIKVSSGTSVTTEATMSSVAKVFAVPELLECILLHLTPIELLRTATRISRVFADTIADSVKLQQKLYLTADNSISQANRMPNELFRVVNRRLKNTYLSFTVPGGEPHHFCVSPQPGDDIVLQVRAAPKAGSCAFMFLSQPPTTKVDIYSHGATEADYRVHKYSWFRTTVENEKGVTWGDACRAMMAEDAEGPPNPRIRRAAKMMR